MYSYHFNGEKLRRILISGDIVKFSKTDFPPLDWKVFIKNSDRHDNEGGEALIETGGRERL